MKSSLLFGSAAFALVKEAVGNSPFASLGCPSAAAVNADWVFDTWSEPCYSCKPQAISGEGAQMCMDASGVVDYASIYVDMASMQSKTGCFAWSTTACTMDIMRVQRIEFDFDVTMCEDLWAAPLWISPTPWQAPAYASGEVDLLEFCPTGTISTNFGAAGGSGEKQLSWASASGPGEPKHFTATFSDNGNLTTQICSLTGANCIAGGYYENYLNTVNAVTGNTSTPFHFNSDVWNGNYGDAGWTGCKAKNNPDTTCQYAVRNIRVYTKDGSPMFSGSKCTAMNGDAGKAVEGTSVIV